MTGAELRSRAKSAGLSVADLADKLGVTKQTVYNWLEGYNVSKRNKPKLYKLLGVRDRDAYDVTGVSISVDRAGRWSWEVRWSNGWKPATGECEGYLGGLAEALMFISGRRDYDAAASLDDHRSI